MSYVEDLLNDLPLDRLPGPPSLIARLMLASLPPGERLAAAREMDIPRDRSRHTFAAWSRALEAYREVGLSEAADREGVPRRTLSRWARDAGARPGVSTAAREAKAQRLARRAAAYRHPASPEAIAEWMRKNIGPAAEDRPWKARSRHTARARAEALRLYCEVGSREAARQTGISLRTIARWASCAQLGAPAESDARTRAATEARRENVARRRRRLFWAIQGMTDAQVEKVEAYLKRDPDADPRPYRSLADARDRMTRARDQPGGRLTVQTAHPTLPSGAKRVPARAD